MVVIFTFIRIFFFLPVVISYQECLFNFWSEDLSKDYFLSSFLKKFAVFPWHNKFFVTHSSFSGLPQNTTSLSRKHVKFGSDCAVNYLWDKGSGEVVGFDSKLFSAYFKSEDGVFILFRRHRDGFFYPHELKLGPCLIYYFCECDYWNTRIPFPSHTYDPTSKHLLKPWPFPRSSKSSVATFTRKLWYINKRGDGAAVLTLGEDVDVTTCSMVVEEKSKTSLPCNPTQHLLFLFRSHLNISWTPLGKEYYHKVLDGVKQSLDNTLGGIFVGTTIWNVENEPNLISIHPLWETMVAQVFYCQSVGNFQTSFFVWISPYSIRVWIFLLLSIFFLSLIASIGRGNPFWEIYFLLSIFIRQPVEDRVPKKYVLFCFISLVLPPLYESFITGNLVAPSFPNPFQNVKDFLDRGTHSEIQFLWKNSDPSSVSPFHPDVLEELKSHNISETTKRIVPNNDTIVRSDWAENLTESSENRFPSGIGLYVPRFHGSLVLKWLQVLSDVCSFSKNGDSEDWRRQKCGRFEMSVTQMSFSTYLTPFASEANRIQVGVMEGGLPQRWLTHVDNTNLLISANIRRAETKGNFGSGLNQFLKIRNLKTFLIIWALFVLGTIFVFLLSHLFRDILVGLVTYLVLRFGYFKVKL